MGYEVSSFTEAGEAVQKLSKTEREQLDAAAIKNMGCDFCGVSAGKSCRIVLYAAQHGRVLEGFAHALRAIGWMELRDLL